MSVQLGTASSIPTSTSPAIVIPSETAPQNQLQTDVKQQIISSQVPIGDTYKLLASSSDSTPGYLSAKLTSGEFSIVSEKLKLAGFGSLTTANLSEGANLYYTQSRFDTAFELKTTDSLTQGVTNKYYATSLFNTDFATKTTDNLTEGITNLYLTSAILSDIQANTTLQETINAYSYNWLALSNYDGTSELQQVNSPLNLTDGILTHLNTAGNKHVPTNAAATNYDILTSTGVETYTWQPVATVVANAAASIFEATPSSSTIKGVQSAYINSHVTNATSNVKHLTDALLAYIDTGGDVPVHIADTLIHLPAITPTTDIGKFLKVNASNLPEWTTSSASITTDGVGTYISASGSVITVDTIDISDTNITAGDKISIVGNTIASTWRDIDTSPTSAANDVSISSGWAYVHENATGAGYHIPTGGTSAQYIAGDGTIKDFNTAPGGIFKITMGSGATGSVTERLAHLDTVFPTGWSGAAGVVTTDLVITHDVAKNPVAVKIYTDDGTDITMLMGSAPYSTIIGNQASTEIKIVSLTTITEKIYIYIQFE